MTRTKAHVKLIIAQAKLVALQHAMSECLNGYAKTAEFRARHRSLSLKIERAQSAACRAEWALEDLATEAV